MKLSNVIAVSAILVSFGMAHSEGNVTYVLHKSENPTEDELDAYEHIQAAMDSALYYYNKYTDLTKFINVYYNTGVPTAEASSNGDLRFGSSRSYMYVGTAMHEIAHTMGMGTTSDYQSMMVNGVFQGEKAQALLKVLDGEDAELHGDSQHFWPYGLNYASEVKSEQDLINHAKIVNAMYQDIFKEAFFMNARIKSLSSGKCMGITSSNALELMECSDDGTRVKIFSVGENPVAYRIQFGSRSIDVPNESTAEGVVLGTYGWNGGAHQKTLLEEAPVNTRDAYYLRNLKSALYLQANEANVVQNSKVNYDDSFVWILVEDIADSSGITIDSTEAKEGDIVVGDSTGKSEEYADDETAETEIVRGRNLLRLDSRVFTGGCKFDAMGRSSLRRARYLKLF